MGAMHNEKVFHLVVEAVSVVHMETLLQSMLLNLPLLGLGTNRQS